MGSMVVGFISAYTSPALVSMQDRNITSFDVSTQEVSFTNAATAVEISYVEKFNKIILFFHSRWQASWVGGLMPLAGLAGGIIGGPLIEYLGRRNTILFTAVPFIVSWLLIALATNIGLVLAGKVVTQTSSELIHSILFSIQDEVWLDFASVLPLYRFPCISARLFSLKWEAHSVSCQPHSVT